MSKFKVGDVVRLTGDGSSVLPLGSIGRVYATYADDAFCNVMWQAINMVSLIATHAIEPFEASPPAEPARPAPSDVGAFPPGTIVEVNSGSHRGPAEVVSYDPTYVAEYRLSRLTAASPDHPSGSEFREYPEHVTAPGGEVARLRKGLEAANVRYLKEVPATNAEPCDHEATIAKLKAFSEDQSKQIAAMEKKIGCLEEDRRFMKSRIGDQMLELNRMKGGLLPPPQEAK